MDIYEQQARWFRNIPLIDPRFRASVHIEDKEDEKFWDYHLQHIAPARYKYISHSKNGSGKETTGCEQCLKYRKFLSDSFFICIDSDLRVMRREPELDAFHYIAQTYTYSWENHCCEAEHLQARLREYIPDIDEAFDFRIFFYRLSEIVYNPLKMLVYYESVNPTAWNLSKFNACITLQPRREQLGDNGKLLLDTIRNNFRTATEGLSLPDGFAVDVEESQAYLHIRGHHLYRLTLHIGTMLCRGRQVAFHTQVLNANYPQEGYPEIIKLNKDLEYITKN